MTAYTKAVSQPLDTDEARRLFGFDPASYDSSQHPFSVLEQFCPEWFDTAISALLDYQRVEVDEPMLATIFEEDGHTIFASLVLVDVPAEYASVAAGKKITRVGSIGHLYKDEEDRQFRIAEFSIDPEIRVYSKAKVPSFDYLPPIVGLKELHDAVKKG